MTKRRYHLYIQGYDWALNINKRTSSCKVRVHQVDIDNLIKRLFRDGYTKEDKEALLVGINSCSKDLIDWEGGRGKRPVYLKWKFYRDRAKIEARIEASFKDRLDAFHVPDHESLQCSIEKVLLGQTYNMKI